MNCKHLHYVMQVAETGSVAAASRQLHLTPQTISGQIQLLGERLGGALYEKVGRRLVLTEEIQARLEVERVGVIEGVEEQFHGISIERRITHPCVLAITRAARSELFQPSRGARRIRAVRARKAA